jgi:hypothetical protein
MKQAAGMGIQQTPTLYVNGEALEGALPAKTLWTMIDRALVSEGITPPPNEFNQPAEKQESAPGSKPTAPATAPVPAPAMAPKPTTGSN